MTLIKGALSVSATDPNQLAFREDPAGPATLELILTPVANPMAPFQQTMPPHLDPNTNEWVWEFRVQRGTGDW